MNSQISSGISVSQSQDSVTPSSPPSPSMSRTIIPNLPQPPLPPPIMSAFEQNTQHQISQLFDALNHLVQSQDQLQSQLQSLVNSAQSSAPPQPSFSPSLESKYDSSAHRSDVGVKRELTPHPSAAASSTIPLSNHNNFNSGSDHLSSSSSSISTNDYYSGSGNHKSLYNGMVKFSAPTKFAGKPGSSPMLLIDFISSMNRYLSAIDVNPKSLASLRVASMGLSEYASQWYDYEVSRKPDVFTSWNTLQEKLRERYQPMAQEQLSLSSLLKVKYKNNIDGLNHEFLKYLQLLPAYNQSEFDPMLIGLYMNALSDVPGTAYISTVLRSGISRKEIKTLNDAMSQALLAESNLGKGIKSASVPFAPSTFGNNNRSAASPSPARTFRPFNRTAGSSFSTPIKINNVAVDNDCSEEQEAGIQFDNEINEVDNAGTPSFHEDTSADPNTSAGTADTSGDESFLNAMKFFEKNIKRNPNLSPEELDRRRRNGTCFKCNLPGHYANKCSAPPHSQSKKL